MPMLRGRSYPNQSPSTNTDTAMDTTSGSANTTPEGSESPRLCEIYLRDVLTFLPRTEINAECCRVSRHVDATVSYCPRAMLPRHKFHTIGVLPWGRDGWGFVSFIELSDSVYNVSSIL
jgi:hypothetical protein